MRGAVASVMVVVALCLLAGAAKAQLGQRASVPSISTLVESASQALQEPAEAASDPSGCADSGARAGHVSTRRLAAALTCLIEDARRTRGLSDLHGSGKLRRAAARHARDMRQHGFFGHRSSNGADVGARARASGYMLGARRWEVGEALHWGEGERSTPRKALEELLHSTAHRAILLSDRMRDIGVAAVTYTRGGSSARSTTYVVNMGRRS